MEGMRNSSLPLTEGWVDYLSEAQPYTLSRVVLLALVSAPLLVVVLNIIRQLVSSVSPF